MLVTCFLTLGNLCEAPKQQREMAFLVSGGSRSWLVSMGSMFLRFSQIHGPLSTEHRTKAPEKLKTLGGKFLRKWSPEPPQTAYQERRKDLPNKALTGLS